MSNPESTHLDAIKAEAGRLRSQAMAAVDAVSAPIPTAAPGEALIAGFFSKEAGRLSRKWTGSSRHGTKLVRDLARDSRAQSRHHARTAKRQEALAYVDRAAAIAADARKYLPRVATRTVDRELAAARAAARPDTILRRVIGGMAKLEAASPTPSAPELPAEKGGVGEDYEALQRLEVGLRGVIEGRLSPLSSRWWDERVPKPARDRAEARMRAHDRPWPWTSATSTSAVEFLDFPDLAELICSEPNWTNAFEAIFGDKDVVRVKLGELQPIRRAIAHSRLLSQAQKAKLRLYADEFRRAIGRD